MCPHNFLLHHLLFSISSHYNHLLIPPSITLAASPLSHWPLFFSLFMFLSLSKTSPTQANHLPCHLHLPHLQPPSPFICLTSGHYSLSYKPNSSSSSSTCRPPNPPSLLFLYQTSKSPISKKLEKKVRNSKHIFLQHNCMGLKISTIVMQQPLNWAAIYSLVIFMIRYSVRRLTYIKETHV